MWTSSTDAHLRWLSALFLGAGLMLFAGCATKPDIGEPTGKKSKYAEQRKGGEAEDSDAVHVPPVPHSEELEAVAEKALPEYVRAMKTMREGDYKKAIVMLQSLSSRFPRLSGPLVNQGIAHLKLKQYEDAEQVLRKAIEVNARNPYAHNNLGVALREQGKFDEARKHYEKALELDPKYARAHFNLGVLAELYLKDLRLALNHFQRYQALQKEKDQNVANWITDLKRRAPDPEPEKKPSQPASGPEKASKKPEAAQSSPTEEAG